MKPSPTQVVVQRAAARMSSTRKRTYEIPVARASGHATILTTATNRPMTNVSPPQRSKYSFAVRRAARAERAVTHFTRRTIGPPAIEPAKYQR